MAILGRCNRVDTFRGPCDLWGGSEPYRIAQEASVLSLTSTTASDWAEGSGARTVSVFGLTSWDQPEVSETVELSGTTAATTQQEFVAVNRIEVTSFGSGQANSGTIRGRLGDQLVSTIQPKAGQSMDLVRSIPAGRQMRITGLHAGVMQSNASEAVDLQLVVNQQPDGDGGWITRQMAGLGSMTFDTQLSVTGPAVIKAQCTFSTCRQVWCSVDAFMVDQAEVS